MRRRVPLRSLLVFLFAVASATPLVASEITSASILAAMNAARAKQGLLPLRADDRLMHAAEDRMRDMEELEYWSHDAPDGRSPFVWLRPNGYEFQHAGENLATGFDTTEVLVEGWMESPGHRANILSADYDDCGIAVIDGSTTRRAMGKSIVVLFGRARTPQQSAQHKAAPPPARREARTVKVWTVDVH